MHDYQSFTLTRLVFYLELSTLSSDTPTGISFEVYKKCFAIAYFILWAEGDELTKEPGKKGHRLNTGSSMKKPNKPCNCLAI